MTGFYKYLSVSVPAAMCLIGSIGFYFLRVRPAATRA